MEGFDRLSAYGLRFKIVLMKHDVLACRIRQGIPQGVLSSGFILEKCRSIILRRWLEKMCIMASVNRPVVVKDEL